MADYKISAQLRQEFGKGAARRVRREERVPAVIYGHGGDPVHVTLPSYDLMMALKSSNALIDLDIEGKSQLVIPKAVQREAIRGFLVHVDLLGVKKGEKVVVEVPFYTEGELAPGGNIMEHMLDTLTVEAEATNIPESFTVSIEGLSAGDSVQAKDVKLPAGTSLAQDEESVLLQVIAAQTEAVEAEEGEGEGAEG
ncbi:50S ribosomal protein L25/general stress protein Ctc [Streptomyces sp. TP-A0874]|uniref:50S ribosomal protein L25/general stress protein Ctc n=1 Tax=Streptomyces sp. TP-A0874 TaxID=549819 RepID=UPI0008537A36|nr:50S ribosomal protein L25/general stress protein Ctc [Streptomyces sp. TP-A0874]